MNVRETQGAPSIEHLCLLGSVSRAGFYRFGEVRAPQRAEAVSYTHLTLPTIA